MNTPRVFITLHILTSFIGSGQTFLAFYSRPKYQEDFQLSICLGILSNVYKIPQIAFMSKEGPELPEFPKDLSVLNPSKEISALEMTFKILTYIVVVAVVLHIICCINVTRLLCRVYLSRPLVSPDQEQHELNEISIN